MPVTLKSSGGGSVTMDVPSTASTYTLTLPAVTGTVLQTGTTVTVAQGGTGLATLTANNVLIGNGTGTPNFVAPGTNGNVLTSNGTTWTSAAASGGSALQYRYQIFSATGSTTWTAPTGVTSVKVLVIGGGSGNFWINSCCNQYGAGGGLSYGFVTVTPGTGYTVTVGTGGAGVSSGTSGSGGSSSFGALISATGGAGSTLATQGAFGAGSGGNIKNNNMGTYSSATYGNSLFFPIIGPSQSTSNTPLTWSSTNNAMPGAAGNASAIRAGNNGLVYIEWVGP